MKKFLPEQAKNVSMNVFNSKLLVKAHVQKLFSFLPLGAYSMLDKLGTAATGKKAYRLMVMIVK